jgi:Uma2 family endonuclease
MSQPAFKALDLPFELVVEDGIPMDHFLDPIQLGLFRDVVDQLMAERERTDYCIGGNNFVYYSPEQAWDVARGRSYFRGPDIFFVDKVPQRPRKAWVAWDEGGRLPDLIVELLSPSTEEIDREEKMDLYARIFRTREYYLFDFDTAILEGYRLTGTSYLPVEPDRQGRFRSGVLGADVGVWHGVAGQQEANWVRLFHPDGRLLPTSAERAVAALQALEAESRKVEAERKRADDAEAELARLRTLLDERNRKE